MGRLSEEHLPWSVLLWARFAIDLVQQYIRWRSDPTLVRGPASQPLPSLIDGTRSLVESCPGKNTPTHLIWTLVMNMGAMISRTGVMLVMTPTVLPVTCAS
jgi:hypothetical protein